MNHHEHKTLRTFAPHDPRDGDEGYTQEEHDVANGYGSDINERAHHFFHSQATNTVKVLHLHNVNN